MDFFQQQDRARRFSFWMVLLFGLAVLLIVAAVDLIACVILSDSLWTPKSSQDQAEAVLALAAITGGTLLVILLGSLFRSWQLRSQGGRGIAEMMGGRLISGATKNLRERRLLNVVEEMALASGVPVPPVYLLEQETAINAFAAGYAPEEAVIAVTHGALETLTRDELQGVIGHEFSHILNGDMRNSIRLIGLLHGIFLIYLIGYFVFRSVLSTPARSSSDDSQNSGFGRLFLILIALWVMLVGCVGVFFGKIIKAAHSRQREFLADASSAQFTRNPAGLAGALKKIMLIPPETQEIQSAGAAEASHLFFSEPSTSFLACLLASHPALPKRILRLDPQFDPTQLPKLQAVFAQEESEDEAILSGLAARGTSENAKPERGSRRLTPTKKKASTAAVSESVTPSAPVSALNPVSAITPIPVAASVEPAPAAASRQASGNSVGLGERMVQAHAASMSTDSGIALRETLANALGASAFVLAILTDPEDSQVQTAQKQTVADLLNGILLRDYQLLLLQVSSMPLVERLMNLQFAIQTMKQLSPPQYQKLRAGIRALIEADHLVDLMEFVIYSMVCRQLDEAFGLRKVSAFSAKLNVSTIHAALVVLSRLAYAGSEEPAAQKNAWLLGLQKLKLPGVNPEAELIPDSECSNPSLQCALKRLDAQRLDWKRHFMEACSAVIFADGTETEEEAILRFGIAASLGVY